MSDVNVAVVYGANGLEFTKTEQTLPLTLNVVANGVVGPVGPAPSGTGLVSVTGGVLDTPSTLSARVAADAANLRTQLGLGTVATQNANNVTLTGGTLQGIGVVTGSYTSNVNEALLRSCRKQSAGTITKGQVVYITGSTGSHLEVELADADTELTSSKTFGVAAETITASTEGYVIVEGLLTGLSNLPSSTFANGASLWLSSTAGGWQTTPPADPANGVYLGRVINASNGNNASAFIRIQNGYELDELHDVAIASPVNGQSLRYDSSTQIWKNDPTIDLKAWAASAAYTLTSATLDGDNVITVATVSWPDGSAGTFTRTNKNATHLTIDAYTITHTASSKTLTQALVTRNGAGKITAQPALTVA